MKHNSPTSVQTPRTILPLMAAVVILGGTASAAVLVDDSWADGSRAEQNLPSESAWYAASASTLTSVPGSMTASIGTSSALWLTYFTAEGTPSMLGLGETLELTTVFTPGTVSPASTSRGLRIGLYNYAAGGTRVAADGFSTSGANGTHVQGYLLEVNFTSLFGDVPLRLRKRTNLGSSNLMGTSGDYTTLATGGGSAGDPGFVSGTPYTLQWTLTRQGDEYSSWMTIACRVHGADLDLSMSCEDYGGEFYGDPVTAFDACAFRPANAADTADTLAFTRLSVEGPAGMRVAPWIVADPTDIALTLGQVARFTVSAGGSSPLAYQWFFNGQSPVPGGTNATLVLPSVLYSSAGAYSVTVSNELGSATSSTAQLTVNPPDFTAPGMILEDLWADGARDNAPVAPDNSVWYASSSGSLTPGDQVMVGSFLSTSRLWVGYFTENPLLPVDLAVGRAIKVTLDFTPINVATWPGSGTSRGLRFALLNYADGATRLTADGFSSSGGNGANVTGYMLNQNFYTTFSLDTPMELRARTSLGSDNLLGTTADYTSLGSGPSGSQGDPGFESDTEYTLEFTVARTAESTVDVLTRIQGGALDLAYSVTDGAYAYHRFDALAIRPNNEANAASEFHFTRFKVEVVAIALPFRVTGIEQPTPDSLKLTWESVAQRVYQVQSRDALASGDWTTMATLTATGSSTSHTQTGVSGTRERYYRVVTSR